MAVFDTPREAFGALRPVCVQLSQAQTAENVRRLQARLEAVGAAALQELQEYVLFPLRLALLGPRPERLLQSAVQCVASVLGTTRVRKRELLLELFSELSTCLSPPPSSGRAAPLSEELKLGVIEALHTLLHAAEGDVILSLYQPASLPLLGFAVSQLLGLAEQERAKQIKVLALSCLQVLVLQCDCGGHGRLGEDEERRCGDLLASFLPGLCVALSRVITGDVKQGHKPAVAALRLFYLLVGSVVADAQLDRVPHDREKPPPEPSRVSELMVHRGPEWSKNTAEKLSILLRNIVECSSAHPHWRVRLELVELAQHLLRNCSRSLLGSCGQLLRALVGLVSDESDEVRGRCLQALRGVAERGLVARSGAFTDVLSESLHGLATALPRLVSAQDDAGKVSTLGLLLGYLKLLGPKINAVLNSTSHLQRLSRALLQVLELDVSEVKIVEGGRWGSGGSWQKGGRQRKYFRFFTDEKVFQLLQQVCRVLGYYGNLYLLVDHFMGLYGDSGAYRQQAAMVLNELLAGAAGAGVDVLVERDAPPDTEDLRASIVSILDEYTDQENWYLVTSAEAEESVPELGGGRSSGAPLPPPEPRPAARTLSANAWQICIQLEGVGCFATLLGPEFRPLLLSTLYPLLEKAGDKTPLISEAALGTLAEVCQACGYASLGGLIKDNTDYLVNGISLSLRQPPHRPRAARVLSAMLSHSDATLLPLVDDVVQDVLSALDLSYSSQASTFLGVLHALLTALAQWFGPPCSEEQPGAAARSSSAAAEHPSRALSQGQQALTGQDLERFFLDYVRQKQIAEGNLPDTEEEEEGEVPPLAEQEPSSCDTEGEAPLPGHAQLAKAVLERCVHLLSHESLRVRLKVLDVLELCVTVLHPHRNHLLPMAHRLWPALLPRLTNDDPLAVLRAFKVLCTLAQTCGDFLRQRVSKDVLPKLTSSLLSQASVSARAGPVYSHTLAFKLQLAVLQGLGSLCEKLDMGESDLNSVADACLVYLSAKQPVRLQEAAQSVFLHLMHLDPDSTWLLLSEVCCPQQYQPPHASLRPVRLRGMGRQRDHFTHNVLLLLERLRERESTAARREPSPP